MSIHVRIYTWMRLRERQPCVITVKFPLNHTGTLAGWLGSLSGGCRAAGLIPTGVQTGPCIYVGKTGDSCNTVDQTDQIFIYQTYNYLLISHTV